MVFFRGRNNSIKSLFFIFLWGSSLFLLNNCDEEKAHSRSYPRVKTDPVSGITSTGATFNGEIFSLGSEPIIDHGFVWSVGEDPSLNNNKVLLGPSDTLGPFRADIISNLSKDVKYTVKAFLKTAEHVIYGVPVHFTSLGSGAPVINGFTPSSVAWFDTLKIVGRNFSYVAINNKVKLNQIMCTVLSSTDTTVLVQVSPNITEIKNIVSVEIEGNIFRYISDTLRLLAPEIRDFFPKKAFWGDTLYVKGKHFRSFTYRPDNSVKLGYVNCVRIGQITDSSISVTIPFELPDIRSALTMKINGITFKAQQAFELLEPFFTFSPKSEIWGNIIKLDGRFNILPSRNTISFFGNNINTPVSQEDILSTTISSIIVRVPYSLSSIKSAIIYKSAPFIITSADTFRIPAPIITSFSPVSGPGGTAVTIKGKYFDINSPIVMFGDNPVGVSYANDSVIIAIAPNDVTEKIKISVKAKLQTVVSSDYFDITNPKITNIFPLTGTFNDEITITVQNLFPDNGRPIVTFQEFPAVVKSYTATAITVMVPPDIDSIPRIITVSSGSSTTSYNQPFILSPPQITSELPVSVKQGYDITINGYGFNPSPGKNIVLLDIYPLEVKSSTRNEIVATMPLSVPRGDFGLKVIVGGYSRSISQKFTFNSQWLRIEAPKIPTRFPFGYGEGITSYGANLKNLGYVCSEASGITYRFDPADKSWTNLNIPSPFDTYSHNIKMGEVVCRDTFYLIGGHFGAYSMKAFDDANGKWRSYNIPVQKAGVAFSLYDNIYFGLDYFSPSSYYFYRIDPLDGYSWERTVDYPYLSALQYSAYFSIGNKGYVGFSDNSVWEFNPDASSYNWQPVASFPGSARVLAFSYVIGDMAYVGGGKSMQYMGPEYNDIWMFDAHNNLWTLSSNLPLPRHSAVAFSIGTKAYIGFGLHNVDGIPSDLYDFYEFDPNYPAK